MRSVPRPHPRAKRVVIISPPLLLFLLWNSWMFFRCLGYWPLGSFWEILSLQAFILEPLELWAFGDLWTLGDGRKSQVTTWNDIWLPYERGSVIKGKMKVSF